MIETFALYLNVHWAHSHLVNLLRYINFTQGSVVGMMTLGSDHESDIPQYGDRYQYGHWYHSISHSHHTLSIYYPYTLLQIK